MHYVAEFTCALVLLFGLFAVSGRPHSRDTPSRLPPTAVDCKLNPSLVGSRDDHHRARDACPWMVRVTRFDRRNVIELLDVPEKRRVRYHHCHHCHLPTNQLFTNFSRSDFDSAADQSVGGPLVICQAMTLVLLCDSTIFIESTYL